MSIATYLAILSTTAFSVISCGCASNRVAYAPIDQTWRGKLGFANSSGYVDQRLGEKTYQVKIGEALKDDWADLEKFAMFRASEIALASGNQYFVVHNVQNQFNDRTVEHPQVTTAETKETESGATLVSTTTPAHVTTVETAWYIMDFEVTDQPVNNGSTIVHDAARVQADLKYFVESRRPKK